jgi:hypothetical protein
MHVIEDKDGKMRAFRWAMDELYGPRPYVELKIQLFSKKEGLCERVSPNDAFVVAEMLRGIANEIKDVMAHYRKRVEYRKSLGTQQPAANGTTK